MDAPDPLLEIEPNFLADPFLQARANLTALNIPEDTITDILRQTWIASRQIRHDAWVEDQRRCQDEPQQDGPPRDKPPHGNDAPQPDPIDDNGARPKAQKAKAFPSGIAYARQKVNKFEYIELWYFSREGLAEASLPTTSTSNDTFGIVTGDLGAVQLCPVATTKASKNALPDESLSWDQISFASKVYVNALRKGQWSDEHILALVSFFSQLDYQRTQLTSVLDKVFIEYQATVRRQWMDAYEFDIAEFNLSRLHAIESRVTMHAHQVALARLGSSSNRSPSPSRSACRPRNTGRTHREARSHTGQPTRKRPLTACAVCLGWHPHKISECRAVTLWNGKAAARCTKDDEGQLIDPHRKPICLDWQRTTGCHRGSHPDQHQCSGCGSSRHGAQRCPLAQPTGT
ncbi:hypothetical protein F5887DRAFT_935570 [Amanita rubescens]|nr:hypothetical protein F5887DRAFT_935570 [Amanita rubescens]